jgi:hypothetical protein
MLAAGGGALMPAVPFNASVWPAGAQPLVSNSEIVRVIAISTDTLTIVRQREGTSARAITVGDQFAASVTQKTLNDNEGKRVISDDTVVKGGYGQSVIGELEIASGAVLELEADSVLEVT